MQKKIKKEKIIIKNIILLSLALMFVTEANAQQGRQLFQYNYTNQQLTNAGCDPAIWQQMNASYIAKRTREGNQESKVLVTQQVSQTLPANIGNGNSCVDLAVAQINQAVQLAGGFGAGADAILSFALKKLGGAGCSEINNLAQSNGANNITGVIQNQNGAAIGILGNGIGNGIGNNTGNNTGNNNLISNIENNNQLNNYQNNNSNNTVNNANNNTNNSLWNKITNVFK